MKDGCHLFTYGVLKISAFNFVSKITEKLFEPLPCHKSIGKMLHAIFISAVAVFTQVSELWPVVSC